MKKSWSIAVLATVAVLMGCSSAKEDWNKASSANTVAAYQDYLNKHPSGEHSADAQDRIHTLQDDAAWSQAKQTNTVDAYKDYLQKQPAGSHDKDAQEAITAAQRAADWKVADAAGTSAAVQDFLKKYPDGPEADAARGKLKSLTGYRVRFSSAKTERQAQREKEKLGGKYSKVVHDVVVIQESTGKRYAVASTPMSQTEAESACSELKKSHLSCEVVKNDSSNG